MMSLTSDQFNNYIKKIKNKVNELYDKINENEQVIRSLENIIAKEAAAINTKIESLVIKDSNNDIIPLSSLQNNYFTYNALYGTLSKSTTKQLNFNLTKFNKYDILKNVDLKVKFIQKGIPPNRDTILKEISLFQDPSLINIFDARDGKVWSYELPVDSNDLVYVSVEITMPHKLINSDKINSIEIKPFPIYSFKLDNVKLDNKTVITGSNSVIANKKYNFTEQRVRKISTNFIVTPENGVATFGLRNIYLEYEKINYNQAELAFTYEHSGNNVSGIEVRDTSGTIIPAEWVVAVDPLFLETISISEITGTVYIKGTLNNDALINPQIKNIIIIKED